MSATINIMPLIQFMALRQNANQLTVLMSAHPLF